MKRTVKTIELTFESKQSTVITRRKRTRKRPLDEEHECVNTEQDSHDSQDSDRKDAEPQGKDS